MYSSDAGIPFRPVALPALGVSEGDKQCMHDYGCIIARHFFAEKNEDFIKAQINALLHSLDIHNDIRIKGPLQDKWATEYRQHQLHGNPEPWADLFEQQHGTNGQASQFEQGSLVGFWMQWYKCIERA
ncbi:peroxisome biogenesis protein 5-like isoform X2 [Tasmannia lanceolata]|uniref:peroxisome biogenesis protein 5-like isoform X2 n=1 Tax=Tasmannia lanceolata TaxID=3420 RepID=UPI004062FB4E